MSHVVSNPSISGTSQDLVSAPGCREHQPAPPPVPDEGPRADVQSQAEPGAATSDSHMDEQAVQKETWASAVKDEVEQVPDALLPLYNNGATFVKARDYTWRIAGGTA